MSLKLFIASTFGLIKSTDRIESEHEALLHDYLIFADFEKSALLKEFLDIEIQTSSPDFKQKKKEIQGLTLKGSVEESQIKEFGKLEKNSRLRKFYITEKSDELKRFTKIIESGIVDQFNSLKKFTESSEFNEEKKSAIARGKKKFETTQAFAKLKEFEQLKKSDDLKFYLKFQKSGSYRNYEKMKNSSELKRLEELEKLAVTKESAHLAELQKLKKNSQLQKFYSTQKSEDLKRFGKIAELGLAEKFNELKTFVSGSDFQNEKRKAIADGKVEFETTETYTKLKQFKQLQSSDDIKFFQTFKKSAGLRNYEQMKDSPVRKRYEELQKLTTSNDFKARVAYLEDKHKWEKTEESGKEKRFSEMQKMPQVINYLKYKNSNAFDFFKKWDLIFEDKFETAKLDNQKWITQSHWAKETLGRNFSQMGDLHAFTEGKNVSIEGKRLKIEVRKEKTTGMQWQIPFGFVEKDFDYSTGIVSTAGLDWWNHGILEAKVKYSPSANFVDAIYLLGEESSPQINLIEMGAKNRMGTLTKTENGILSESESISGLKAGAFYIFRLEWSSGSLVWKINGKEIKSMNLHVPSHSMHLNAASIVVSEPNGNLPHQFEIDWIKFYQHHNA